MLYRKGVQFLTLKPNNVKMKVKTLRVSRLFSLGNYENVSFSYEVELDEKDQVDSCRTALLDQIDADLAFVKERKERSRKLANEKWKLKHRLSEIERLEKDPRLIDPDDDMPF